MIHEEIQLSHGWSWDENDVRVPRGEYYVEREPYGMQLWDLRFYAGCQRQPQVIHRVLDFHDRHPWRFHYGQDGTAKSYADLHEGEFRTAVRQYVNECRRLYNAGEDVDDAREPSPRPRSIEYDLW